VKGEWRGDKDLDWRDEMGREGGGGRTDAEVSRARVWGRGKIVFMQLH
jgi:hypothetical protein